MARWLRRITPACAPVFITILEGDLLCLEHILPQARHFIFVDAMIGHPPGQIHWLAGGSPPPPPERPLPRPCGASAQAFHREPPPDAAGLNPAFQLPSAGCGDHPGVITASDSGQLPGRAALSFHQSDLLHTLAILQRLGLPAGFPGYEIAFITVSCPARFSRCLSPPVRQAAKALVRQLGRRITAAGVPPLAEFYENVPPVRPV